MGNKHKKKRQQAKPVYVKGASWQDVLSGRPVLANEVSQQQNRPERMKRLKYRCLKCEKTRHIKTFGDREVSCVVCGSGMVRLPS